MSTRRGLMLALAVIGALLIIGAVVTAVTSSTSDDPQGSGALQLRPVVAGEPLEGEPCPPVTTNAESATLCDRDESIAVELGPVLVDGADVATAEASLAAPLEDSWVVTITLNEQGTQDFAAATEAAVSSPPPANRIAVVVDDVVVIVPEINETITSGVIEVGGFTQAEAEDLAAQLS